MLFGTPALFRLRSWPLWFGLCFLPQLYQWAIDSVFESGSRHHLGYIGLLSVGVAMVMSTVAARERPGAVAATSPTASEALRAAS